MKAFARLVMAGLLVLLAYLCISTTITAMKVIVALQSHAV